MIVHDINLKFIIYYTVIIIDNDDDVVTQVLVYSGQLDVIVALPLTEAMLLTVPWKYQSEYLRVPRKVWRVRPTDVEVAGYVRRVHDFYQVGCPIHFCIFHPHLCGFMD